MGCNISQITKGRWSTAKEGCHSVRSGAPTPSGAQSLPESSPTPGKAFSDLSVNSLPPHTAGALQWVSILHSRNKGPASTSTGLLESLDSKGEQGQEGVTSGSDVHTPDWRRTRRLSKCCRASPTSGQGLAVTRELRGRGKSCDLLEAGGRAMGKEEGVGGREGFLPGLPVEG